MAALAEQIVLSHPTIHPAQPMRSWTQRLSAPVDIAFLVFFRIAFGAIMLWEAWRYLHYGWVEHDYIAPQFHFTYYGFDWVRTWPGAGMYVHFTALGVLATFVLAGALYRLCAFLLFLAITYVFLLESAYYLNHIYLVCLIAFLMIFLPAHRALSVDALLRPHIRSRTAPAWTLWLLRFQIGVPYFYGGLAKLNADWLRGEPMGRMLRDASGLPWIGPSLTEPWAANAFAYGGLVFDLAVVPLLLWRKTRVIAYTVAVLFHLTNATIFQLGIFPWFMIAATLVFFPPDWPRIVIRWIRRRKSGIEIAAKSKEQKTPFNRQLGRWTLSLLAVYVAVQMVVPFRHYLYPGNVSWTEEGHFFSWHMKLRVKDGVQPMFYATNRDQRWTRPVVPGGYLNPRQLNRMAVHPDMLLQFSHFLADELRRQGLGDVEIRVLTGVSLNTRRPQMLVDPRIDLSGQPRSIWPKPWILTLTEPLPERPWEWTNLPVQRADGTTELD